MTKRKKSVPKVAALSKEILALSSTLEAHSEQLQALKDVPDSLSKLTTAIETLQGSLTQQSLDDDNADPDGNSVHIEDEISNLMMKSRPGKYLPSYI